VVVDNHRPALKVGFGAQGRDRALEVGASARRRATPPHCQPCARGQQALGSVAFQPRISPSVSVAGRL